ncbi:MAG: hypothetical protein IPN57_12445 [Ignavibacteria bacterium]|nr:hypothetical protein [Ignavibacteria bacterium]
MNFKAAKCPSCGGDLQIPDDRDFVNCMYCTTLIKVRDAILLKPDVNTENLLEIAFEAVKQRNFEEAIEYANKVLETDIKNRLAWWVKAVACINSSSGDIYKIREGLAYSLKAYNLSDGKDKAEIKEKMISELIEHDLWMSHIDYLFEVFVAYGADDERIPVKIIEMTNAVISDNICKRRGNNYDLSEIDEFSEKQVKALQYLEKINPVKYIELKSKNYNEKNDSYSVRKSELDNYKTTVFTKLFGKSIIVTIIGILFLSITASFNKGEFNSTMFISFLIIFSVVYLIVLNLLSHSSTAKFEKDKFGNNIIFK